MKISDITRRNIVDYLLIQGNQFHGDLELTDFLKRTWDLENMPSTDHRFKNASGDIWQHMVNNNDWEYAYLLNKHLNLLKCNDETFIRFVESCVHPLLFKNEDVVKTKVNEFNDYLEKDGFRLVKFSEISGRSIFKIQAIPEFNFEKKSKDIYEVVLSFAGEEREYVEKVAEILKHNSVNLFYDKYEEASLWGKELTEHLDKVYRGSARYCVIFISKHYKDKVWPTQEKRSALVRALEEKEEYILPARFDDTEIPGLRPTIGYVSLKDKTPKELALLILQKLGRL